MRRVIFEDERPPIAVDPGRTDIACFVGLVRFTGRTLPRGVVDWLSATGWLDGPHARPEILSDPVDVPVPIESWPAFTALFDAGGSAAGSGTDYLAAAVRMFLAQGGRRCYVVRMGDPLTPQDGAAAKAEKLAAMLPGATYRPEDPRSWKGIGHLGGLPEVSFLLLPDLPALAASAPAGITGAEPSIPPGPEQFVECAQADITPPQLRVFDAPAPRLSAADYSRWSAAVESVIRYLSQGDAREVLLVAALPLPQNPDRAGPETALTGAISSAFLELAYPWLKTTGSHVLLESLEPPDGALAGMLARNALTRGTFTSAARITPADIVDIFPAATPPALEDRVSRFGFTPSGMRLLSDLTTYDGLAYRQAPVTRLVAVIRRAARRLGEEIVFYPNGPSAWARVEAFLRQFMTRLWTLDALAGATAKDAFSVRCDRSTMTQNDLDNGRLVAEVSCTAAATIERIRVVLSLETSGASGTGAAAPVVVA